MTINSLKLQAGSSLPRGLPPTLAWQNQAATRRILACVLTLWLALTSGSASGHTNTAQGDLSELSLEELLGIEVVYAASKYEQGVADAPASVTVVTADDIQKAGYRTLAEILEGVRGFYTTYDRNYHYVGVRGFSRPGDYNSRLLLMVNGHRLNDNVSGSASIGTEFPLDVDLIERVEIVRGPSSSLYGTSAFLAVANVVTQDGGQLDGLSAAVRLGSFNSREAQLTYGNRLENGVEVLVSGTVSEIDGQDLFFKEFDDPETNQGVARGGDYEQFESFFALLSYKDLTLQAAAVSSEKGFPTASYETVFNDPRNHTVDENAHLDLLYEHAFANQMGLMARVFADRYEYDGDYVYDYSEEEDEEPYIVVNKDWSRGDWWGAELQLSKLFSEDHRAILGLDFRDNIRQDQGNFDEEIFLDDRRSSQNWGIFLQDEVALSRKLRLNVGVRHDHYDTFGGTTNPRAALLLSPRQSSTVKLLYGTAFRAPNAYELYYHDDGFSQKPSLNLQPEEIRTYELVWEQEIGQRTRAAVSLFDYEISNLISLVNDPEDELLVFLNVDEAAAEGFEIELQGRWKRRLTTLLSYTHQDAKDTRTHERLTNSPRHLAKLQARAPLVESTLFANLELNYTGDRLAVSGRRAEDFILANFTLSGRYWDERLEISAGVYNLLDEEYAHPASEEHEQDVIVQDGRTWRLKLRYSF